MTAVLVGVCAAAVLTGCGEQEAGVGTAPERSYDGPLHVEQADAEHPRAGAAGDVVECRTWGSGGYAGDGEYSEGATADSPEEALEVARSEGGFSGTSDGLQVAKDEGDRVLHVLEVDGEVKQAVIVRGGPASEGAGGAGWYVESWARCDYSELPRSYTDSIGLQVWDDRDGLPAPTTEIEAWAGPEHCGWQSMTFLDLGGVTYVRTPLPELRGYFDRPYEEHASLPEGAEDTGFRRHGDTLWVAPDKAAAYVGSSGDVEVWPRAVQPLGCD